MRPVEPTATTLVITVLLLSSAMANTFWRNITSSGIITTSTYLTFRHDHKLIVAAQDDAGSYIASGGTIHGSYLEAALQKLHDDNPDLRVNDMELTSAILAGGEQSAVQQQAPATPPPPGDEVTRGSRPAARRHRTGCGRRRRCLLG